MKCPYCELTTMSQVYLEHHIEFNHKNKGDE